MPKLSLWLKDVWIPEEINLLWHNCLVYLALRPIQRIIYLNKSLSNIGRIHRNIGYNREPRKQTQSPAFLSGNCWYSCTNQNRKFKHSQESLQYWQIHQCFSVVVNQNLVEYVIPYCKGYRFTFIYQQQ